MSSSTIRARLFDDIKADLPDTWRVIDGLWTITDPDRPTLWLEYSALEPGAAAPGSTVDTTIDVCIVTQYKDLRLAEDEGDEDVLVIYGALLRSQIVTGVSAGKTVWEDQYLGWRVSCTVTLPNDTFTDPAETE